MIDPVLLSSLYDNMMSPVYVLDKDGNFIYTNVAFLRLASVKASSLPALNAYELNRQGVISESASLKALRERRRVTLTCLESNLKKPAAHNIVTATPVFDGDGEIQYIFTEIIRLEELERQMETSYISQSDPVLPETPPPRKGAQTVIATSPQMRQLLALAAEVATVDSTILLTGETGTGKDVIAHYIHEHSPRSSKPLLAINCAALPESLLESELFGHERGAYTGAASTGKQGLLQQAHGGTLFLDEVNSMPLSVQSKLLRVLETKKVKRLGALTEEDVDFRLIAATNQDLTACVRAGTFRADLYYRLSVVPLRIPPLRERKEDIIPLALRFIDRYCKRYDRTKLITAEVLDRLVSYDWPGNVRELKNVIERLVVSSTASTVEIKQLPDNILGGERGAAVRPAHPLSWEVYYQSDPDRFSLKSYIDLCESQVIDGALQLCGNTRDAAHLLKTDQSTVVRKRQKYSRKHTEAE